MVNDFAHLHLHTEYSLLDGIQKIRPLVEKIKSLGMNSAAITDHGTMAGVYEFWLTCKEFGIKPIIGCEVYVAKRTRFDKEAGIDNHRSHITLIAKDDEGLHNLYKMVSKSYTEGFYYKPRVDSELLQKYGKGLIALTGCMGSKFDKSLRNGKKDKAIEWLKFLNEAMDEVYIELMRINVPEAEIVIPEKLQIAKDLKLKTLATCDVHYLEQKDYIIQEIAWCISDGRKLSDPERRQYPSTEFYVKSPVQMKKLFPDIPEAVLNTQKLADSIKEYKMEYGRIQPRFNPKLTESGTKYLLNEHVKKKIKKRYKKVTPEIKERINYELNLIDEKGYNDYFLVVEDYVDWARKNNILVGPGRGSGAGSVVAYILGITNIDPIKFNLIFERFLNPGRSSPPDFDIDFQDDRRDELFEYMSKRYGADHTSFVGTFGRLKTKAAIRDVARVMGIDLRTADILSKMVIVKFGKVYPIVKMRKESLEFDNMIKSSPELETLAKYVEKLEDIARHVSMHACGYLVTPRPVIKYLPIQIDSKNDRKEMTQFEGAFLEPIGLMKFDFLGLANLTIISKTLKLILENHKVKIDMDKLPLDDQKTFQLFKKGNTDGIFQFESEGMKKHLRELQPNELEDLTFLNAAYRPGPMQYIHSYIQRKHGKEKFSYLDPSLEPILKSTYGFAIYQEQVMNIAVLFAGYSLGEADILRRAMGKKKLEVMLKEKETFIKKAKQKGHQEKIAKDIFSFLEPFADYGFNRSHSVCYSMIAYQTAYLKTHYPVEFMASLMETNRNSPDKLKKDLKAARDIGLRLLPPDINESFVSFKIQGEKAIRYGFSGIKGAGEKVMSNIVKTRKTKGKYLNLDDLMHKVGTENLTKKDLECLIKVGALDQFGYRNQLLEAMPLIYEKFAKNLKNLTNGQTNLFETNKKLANATISKTELPNPPKESELEKLNWEKEMLGTFISMHPLEKYQYLYSNKECMKINEITKLQKNHKATIICLVTRIKEIYTKKENKPMAFVQLEDTYLQTDAVIFPGKYAEIKPKLIENHPYIVKGTCDARNGFSSFKIDTLDLLEEYIPQKEITIYLLPETTKKIITKLKEYIQKNPGPVKLKVIYGSNGSKKSLIKLINPIPEFLKFIETNFK